MDLAGRHVVVTGASRGIGRRLAHRLVEKGARVTLVARSHSQLQRMAEELGPVARAVPADLASGDATDRIVAAARLEHGEIDVLVNNAGVEFASAYARQDRAEVVETIQVNLLGAMLLTRAVLPSMIERGGGHILNVASLAGLSGSPYEAAYSASKFGLVGFTQALRAELTGTGVGCSVVCPGFVGEDGMYARLAEGGVEASALLGVSPLDRVVDQVLRAIASDRPLTIVNPTPLRPLIALQTLFPGMHTWAMRTFGVTALFRAASELRAAAALPDESDQPTRR